MSSHRVFVVGVGLTKFEKPETKQWDYPEMGQEAGKHLCELQHAQMVLITIMTMFLIIIDIYQD